MAETSQIENNHKNLVSQIENSGRVDREETIRLVEEAMTSIREETNPEMKEKKIQAYEKLRKEIIEKYINTLSITKEDIRKLSNDIKALNDINITKQASEYIEKINGGNFNINEVSNFMSTNKDIKGTILEGINDIESAKLVIKGLGNNNEKEIVHLFSLLNPKVRKDFSLIVETFTKLSKREDITELSVLVSQETNSTEDVKRIILELTNCSTKAGTISSIVLETFPGLNQSQKNDWGREIINKFIESNKIDEISNFLHDINPISYNYLLELHRDKGALVSRTNRLEGVEKLVKMMGQKGPEEQLNEIFEVASENRKVNSQKLITDLDRWTKSLSQGGKVLDLSDTDIEQLNTQLFATGYEENKGKLIYILGKYPSYFKRLTALHEKKDFIIALLQTPQRSEFIPSIGAGLQNDREILDKIFTSKEDVKKFLPSLKGISEENQQYLKSKFTELGVDVSDLGVRGLSMRYNREELSQVQKELETQKIEVNSKANTPTDKSGEIKERQNENGTYNIVISGTFIPNLSEQEYQKVSNNETAKENLLHFYSVLQDCGLEQIWGQRETIFKAISNKEGKEKFNTDNGDYLSKNEVRIFLQAIVKSIAPQFEKQEKLPTVLNSENEEEVTKFIIDNNGENNLLGPAKDKFGRTKLVEIFNDTFFPQEKQRVFQFAQFESAIRS